MFVAFDISCNVELMVKSAEHVPQFSLYIHASCGGPSADPYFMVLIQFEGEGKRLYWR